MTEDTEKPFDSRTFVWGVLLIAAGLIFLVGRIDFGYAIERYWPMIVIAVGAVKLVTGRPPGSGLGIIAVGAWLQVTHLGLWGLTWSNSWPLLLIGVGASMVVQFFLAAAAGPANEGPRE